MITVQFFVLKNALQASSSQSHIPTWPLHWFYWQTLGDEIIIYCFPAWSPDIFYRFTSSAGKSKCNYLAINPLLHYHLATISPKCLYISCLHFTAMSHAHLPRCYQVLTTKVSTRCRTDGPGPRCVSFVLLCVSMCPCVLSLFLSLSPLYTLQFSKKPGIAANTKFLIPFGLRLLETWWGNKQGPISCVNGLVCNQKHNTGNSTCNTNRYSIEKG